MSENNIINTYTNTYSNTTVWLRNRGRVITVNFDMSKTLPLLREIYGEYPDYCPLKVLNANAKADKGNLILSIRLGEVEPRV